MDENKDTVQDRVSRLFDNRTLRIQAFGSNVAGERAYRRAERLVAAIYLVTNHVPAEEPIRMRSRETAMRFLSAAIELRDDMRSPESPHVKKALAIVRELISLVRTLAVSGHVSRENAQVLVEALDGLASFVVSAQRTSLSEEFPISRGDLFEAEQLAPARISDMSFNKKGRTRVIKDRIGKADVSGKEGVPARGERIANILVNQGKLGIKDIAASLPEYSEKMIQRELKGLVESGRIKKEGSKRWSTYSLVQ